MIPEGISNLKMGRAAGGDLMGIFTEIGRALSRRNKIEIIYMDRKGEHTQRVIRPLYLFSYQNWERETHIYLAAFCQLRNAYRVFRLDGVQRLTHLNETFSLQGHSPPVDPGGQWGKEMLSGFHLPKVEVLQAVFDAGREIASSSAREKESSPTPPSKAGCLLFLVALMAVLYIYLAFF